MVALHFEQDRQLWRVRWTSTEGRKSRRFKHEGDARAFASAVTEVRRPRGGRKPIPMTPDNIRATIKDRTVIDDNGCWIWTAKGGTNGYAQMTRTVRGRVTTFSVHRLSYEAFVAPIPAGLTIDHLCGVAKCVNPAHLEPVTLTENNRRRDERIGALR